MVHLVPGSEQCYRTGKRARSTTKIVGKAKGRVFNLAAFGLALELFINFVDHSNSAGTDGVSKAFQATIGVHWKLAFEAKRACRDIVTGTPSRTETQVFLDDQLSDGKAVMHHS